MEYKVLMENHIFADTQIDWDEKRTTVQSINSIFAEKKRNKMRAKQSLFTANVAMEKYFDEYEHYNFERKYVEPQTRKGRSKKEAAQNTNRPSPAGHERKVATKLQNAEKNQRECKNWLKDQTLGENHTEQPPTDEEDGIWIKHWKLKDNQPRKWRKKQNKSLVYCNVCEWNKNHKPLNHQKKRRKNEEN